MMEYPSSFFHLTSSIFTSLDVKIDSLQTQRLKEDVTDDHRYKIQ